MSDAVHVLLVEDNPGDVRLTQEVMRDAAVPAELHVVGDGEQALEFLRGAGRFAGSPRPELVLLDLNLPRKSGTEVLRECKADPDLRRIPVVVLSGSDAERDVEDAYALHANAYVTKPIDLAAFMAAIRAIERFWLEIATRPRH